MPHQKQIHKKIIPQTYILYDRYGLALLELFSDIVIRSTNVHIMSVTL